MDNMLWFVLPIVVVLSATHLFKPKWGWIIGARQHLTFEDLGSVLNDKKRVHSPDIPAQQYPGAQNFQFLDGTSSILYHRTINEGWIVETVNIYVPRKVGIKFTLKDSRMVTLEKPRGTFYQNPTLSAEHWAIVVGLMNRIRELVGVQTT
ncbi:MAG: hypothetical protein Q7S26_02050 [bacterium]|nr:hypothetical protein [bacterium]